MKQRVNNSWRRVTAWMWGGRCVLCRAGTAAADTLCDGCRADLPWLRAACARCAAVLPSDADGRVCGKCQRKTPPFQRARAALHYCAPVDRLIVNLKFHGRLEQARVLGELLATRVANATNMPDAIVPVPLHRTRLRERGYNQSLEIARVLARRIRLPVLARTAVRVRATAAQTTLPLARRARNVRSAFAVNSAVKGKRIAIVDDVMTSGHTVSALAKALRRAGATDVSVWVVARA